MPNALNISDSVSAEETAKFFENLGLPIPQKEEFYLNVRNTDRRLVFLSDYGIVIRFTPAKSFLDIESIHRLYPLFTRLAGNYRIDIEPGIKCPVSQREASQIYHMLLRDHGILITDDTVHNFGFLPLDGIRFPILIDIDEYVITGQSRPDIQDHSLGDIIQFREHLSSDRNIQKELYGPLQDILNAAWPSNQEKPRFSGIREFFKMARLYRNKGALLASWENPENSYRRTHECAAAYKDRLQQVNFV